MTPPELETHIMSLDETQYKEFIKDRIGRLNPDQQAIAWTREAKKEERIELIKKMIASPDEEVQERFLDALRDGDDFNCEHGRSLAKHCLSCGEIDHLMYPELFDKDGFEIDSDE